MPADIFGEGSVAATVMLQLLLDVADVAVSRDTFVADWHDMATHPLLATALEDPAFFARLDELVAPVTWGAPRPADQGFGFVATMLARRHGSERFASLAVKVADGAFNEGDDRTAESLVHSLEEELAARENAVARRRLQGLRARLAVARGDSESAVALLQQGVEASLQAGEREAAIHLLVDLIPALKTTGAIDAALARAEQLVALARELCDARTLSVCLGQQGNVLLAIGRYAEAGDAFTAALASARAAGDEKSQSNWLGDLGLVHQGQGNYQQAREYHEQALALSKRIGDQYSIETDHTHLAYALSAAGDEDAAIEQARAALEIAEARGDAADAENRRAGLQEVLVRRGEFGAASALQRSAPRTEPILATAGLLEDRAEEPEQTDGERQLDVDFMRLMNERDVAGAEKALEDFLQQNHDSPTAHFLQGRQQYARKEYAAAARAYERALALFPRWGFAHINRVMCFEHMGKVAEVLAEYERAVLDQPYEPLYRAALGICYSSAGNSVEALRQLRTARALDPRSYTAARYLAEELYFQALAQMNDERVDEAWASFTESIKMLDEASELNARHRADALSGAAGYCFEFARRSRQVSGDLERLFNPRQMYGREELDLLGRAIDYSLKTMAADAHFKRPQLVIEAVLKELLIFAEPVSLTQVGHRLRAAGQYVFAQPLLELALNQLEQQPATGKRAEVEAQASFELGVVLTAGRGPRDRAEAERLLRRAVELEPEQVDYVGALRQLQRSHAQTPAQSPT